MKIALITGSCGLVGSESVEFFIKKKFTVIGIDNDLRKFFFGSDGSTNWVKNKLIKANLASNTKIISFSLFQLIFSIPILLIGIFYSRYRINSFNYFNKCFRNFFYLISKITRFKGEKNSVTHDLNF